MRPCDICGRLSGIPDDDYECQLCCTDFNECCKDQWFDEKVEMTVCVGCGAKFRYQWTNRAS